MVLGNVELSFEMFVCKLQQNLNNKVIILKCVFSTCNMLDCGIIIAFCVVLTANLRLQLKYAKFVQQRVEKRR